MYLPNLHGLSIVESSYLGSNIATGFTTTPSNHHGILQHIHALRLHPTILCFKFLQLRFRRTHDHYTLSLDLSLLPHLRHARISSNYPCS